ncbi:MAG: hypothetical protein GTO63_21920, partial [Anaerolineae bacterium]|nr:hypothetical protein [Anaerolineae bacterium]NIN97446.1 hypothetical protein [Anaerolineae bacterium]
WLEPFVIPLVKPFAATREVMARRPWDSIWQTMNAYLTNTWLTDFYFGFIYIACGER